MSTMAAFNQKIPPSPAAALPTVTFPTRATFHWNGNTVNVIHVRITNILALLGLGDIVVASAQAGQAEHEAPRGGQLEEPGQEERREKQSEGQRGGPQGKLAAHVERLRLGRRAQVEEREEIARDARLLGGAGQLHAREQLRGTGQEPCQRLVVARGRALQRRAQAEEDEENGRGEDDRRRRHPGDGSRGEGSEQRSRAERHRPPGEQKGKAAQDRQPPRPPPGAAEHRVDLAPSRKALVQEGREPGGEEPAQLGNLCRLRQLHRVPAQDVGLSAGLQARKTIVV